MATFSQFLQARIRVTSLYRNRALTNIKKDLEGLELPEGFDSAEKRLVEIDHFRLFYQSLLEGRLADGFDYKNFVKVFNNLYPEWRSVAGDSVSGFLAGVESGASASLDSYVALFAKLEEGADEQHSPVTVDGVRSKIYTFPDMATKQFNDALGVLQSSIDQTLQIDITQLAKALNEERSAVLVQSASLKQQRGALSAGLRDASHEAYEARLREEEAIAVREMVTRDLITQAGNLARFVDPEIFLHNIASLLRLSADDKRIKEIIKSAISGFPDAAKLAKAVVDLVTEVELGFSEELAEQAKVLDAKFSAVRDELIKSNARENLLQGRIAKTREQNESEIILREEIAKLLKLKDQLRAEQSAEAKQSAKALMLDLRTAAAQNELLFQDIEALQAQLKAKADVESRNQVLESNLVEVHGETDSLSRQLEESKLKFIAKEKELGGARRELADLQMDFEREKEKVVALNRGLEAQLDRAKRERQTAIDSSEHLQSEYGRLFTTLEDEFKVEKSKLASEVAKREKLIATLQQTNAELGQDNDALVLDLHQLQTRFDQAERDREQAYNSAADANGKVAALESKLEELVTTSKEKGSAHQQALSDLRTELDTAQKEKAAAEARARKSKTDRDELAKELATLSLLKEAVDKRVIAAESKARELADANAQLNTALAAVQGELSEIKAAHESLQAEKEQVVQRARDLQAEIDRLGKAAEASGNEKDQAQQQMEALQAKLTAARDDIAIKDEALIDLEGQLRSLTAAKDKLERETTAAIEKAGQRAAKAEEDAGKRIAAAERKAAERIAAAKEEAAKRIAAAKAEFEGLNQRLRREHKANLAQLKAGHDNQIATLTSSGKESEQAVVRLNEHHKADLDRMQQDHAAELRKAQEAHDEDLARINGELAKAKGEKETADGKAAQAEERATRFESKARELADANAELATLLGAVQGKLSKLEAAQGKLQAEKEQVVQRARDLQAEIDRLGKAAEASGNEKDQAQQQMEALQAKLTAARDDIAIKDEALIDLEGQLRSLTAAKDKLERETTAAIEKANQKAAKAEGEAAERIAALEAKFTSTNQQLKEQHKAKLAQLKADHDNQIATLATTSGEESEQAVAKLRKNHQKALDSMQQDHEKALADAKATYDEELARIKSAAEEKARQNIAAAKEEAKAEITAANQRADRRVTAVESKARELADANAELATLLADVQGKLRELKAEHKTLQAEKELAVKRARELEAEIRQVNENAELSGEKIDQQLRDLQAQLTAAQRDAATKAEKLTGLEEQLRGLTTANTELESRVSIAEASVRKAEQRDAEVNKRIAAEIEELKAKNNGLVVERDKLAEEIREDFKKAGLRAAKAEGEAERLRVENGLLSEMVGKFKAEIAVLNQKFATIEDAEARSAEIQEEIESLKVQYDSRLEKERVEKAQLQKALEGAEQNLRSVTTKRDETIAASEAAARVNALLQQENERLQAQFEKLNATLTNLVAEKTTLQKTISAQKKEVAKANQKAQGLVAQLKQAQEKLKSGLVTAKEVAAKNIELQGLNSLIQSSREDLDKLRVLKEKQDEELRSLTELLKARNADNEKLQQGLRASQVAVSVAEKRANASDAKLREAQDAAYLVRQQVDEKDAEIDGLTAENKELRQQLASLQAEIEKSREMDRSAPQTANVATNTIDSNERERVQVRSRPGSWMAPAFAAQTSISMEKVFNDTCNFLFTNRIASNNRFSVALNSKKQFYEIAFDFDRQTAEALAESIDQTGNRKNVRRNDLAIIKAYHLIKGGLPDGYHYDMSISNTRPKGTLKGEKDNEKIRELAIQCLANLTAEEKDSIKAFSSRVIREREPKANYSGR